MTRRKPADRAAKQAPPLKPWARMSNVEQKQALEDLRRLTGPRTTPMPPEQMSKAPRCPLCGVVLDIDARTTLIGGRRVAYFTLTALSQRHVNTPHTIEVNDQGEPA